MLHNHPGLCLIFRKACEKVANVKNSKKVFSVTGLYQEVFSDVDFFFDRIR